MGARDLTRSVEIDAVFERFPASVRGALIFRGLDPEPHQVSVVASSVAELRSPGRALRPLLPDRVTVEIPPRGEILVPFDVQFAGLGPGWYAVSAEALVDGGRGVRGPVDPVRRFLVPWPRGTVRRGTVAQGVRVDGKGATIDRVECRLDSAVVHWRHGSGEEFGEIRVLADDRSLPVLDSTRDASKGNRTTVVYPLLKEHSVVRFEVDRGRAGRRKRLTATIRL